VKLFRDIEGEGAPLLLLHGGYGLDHTYFWPWLDPLRMRLILPDQRGCGRSPRDGLEQATFATLSADLEDLREELGLERWTVLGHSFGSYVALDYAHRYPERVQKLALVAGAPALDYPDVIGANLMKRGTPEQAALLQKAMSAPLESDDEFRRGWNLILPLYFHDFDPTVAARMDEKIRYSAPALFHGFRMLSRFSALPWLQDLRMPTLVAGGRDDWIAPPTQGSERLARGLPHAQLAIFEQSGHFPFIEEQERFLSVLTEFLGDLVEPELG
jgi:proline iminopeptidase